MTFVFDNMASEIKRNPTTEEVQKVLDQKIRAEEIYKRYEELYMSKKVSGVDVGRSERLWERYLNEYNHYISLFNKYMGYCY